MKVVGWIIGIIVAIPCVLIATTISQLVVAEYADDFVRGFNKGGDGTFTMTSSSLLGITSWIFLIAYALIAFFIMRRILRPNPAPINLPAP